MRGPAQRDRPAPLLMAGKRQHRHIVTPALGSLLPATQPCTASREQSEQQGSRPPSPRGRRAAIMKEANKEAAAQCLEVAERALAAGDLEKAQRFVEKAQRLFPTDLVRPGEAMEGLQGASEPCAFPGCPGALLSLLTAWWGASALRDCARPPG